MNSFDAQACKHEALHAVAALHYGRKLRSVVRLRDCGFTFSSAPGRDSQWEAIDQAVVLLLPYLDFLPGCAKDLRALSGLVACGVPLAFVWGTAESLLGDHGFRRRVRVVERALQERPALSGQEVEDLLKEAR